MSNLKSKISKLFIDSLMNYEGYEVPEHFDNEISLGEKILISIPHLYPFDWKVDYNKNYLDIFTHYYDGETIIYQFITKKIGTTVVSFKCYLIFSNEKIIKIPYYLKINNTNNIH